MTVAEAFRHTAQSRQHAFAHEVAEDFFGQVEGFLAQGYSPVDSSAAFRPLFEECRASNRAIFRDALVEVIVELDEMAA